MTNRPTWLKKTGRAIVFFLRTIIAVSVLLLIYVLCIVFSNGYGHGIAAATTTILFIIATCILFRKLTWIQHIVKLIIFFSIMLALSAGIIYTVIPVATDTAPKVAIDFANVKTQYWQLHTGSKIAYYKFAAKAGITKKSSPIIFLHGGPGAYVRRIDINFFSTFTDDGYDVYLYDQAGAGRSGLLPKEEYSHERNLEDFKAIIDQINAPQYIVIGQSYGGSMLAHLTADSTVGSRIEKAIIVEPGITVPQKDETEVLPKAPNAGKEDADIPPRLFMGFMINPTGNFASQEEAINYFTAHQELAQRLFKQSFPAKDSNRLPLVDTSILNIMIVGIIPSKVGEYNKHLAADYQHVHVPTMLMLGESSYINRHAPMDILAINPNIQRVQYFKGVGHILWNGLDDNNQRVKQSMLDFLNDRQSVIADYPKKKDIGQFLRERL